MSEIQINEIFPKEVMEKAEWWAFRDRDGDVDELLDTPESAIEYFIAYDEDFGEFGVGAPCEITLVALSDEDVETDLGTMKKVIAERVIRVSLTIESVDKEAPYKEKDMISDRYEFPLDEWKYEIAGYGPYKVILTRQKPKVECPESIPVKVEWSKCSRFGDGLGEDGINFERHGYGMYYIVQFRVTGWNGEETFDYFEKGVLRSLVRNSPESVYHNLFGDEGLYIGRDAIGKWSVPVLVPERIYKKLPEICRELENKANEAEG